MSYLSPMGLEPSLVDMGQHPLKQTQEWIPPPASLAVINPEGIDLNDEIFFNHNTAAYTTFDPYAGGQDAGALLLTLLLATVPFTLLQTAMTTPDLLLASPLKYGAASFNQHYSHRRRFSLAVEQLNRMSLRTSKLPLPDSYHDMLDHHMEERTINPRQLLGNAASSPLQAAPDAAAVGIPGAASRYILPLLVLSPSLSTFFSHADIPDMADLPLPDASVNPERLSVGFVTPEVPSESRDTAVLPTNSAYVMNDECVNAITYWLNNTDGVVHESQAAPTIHKPSSVGKPVWKRRNSIPVAARPDMSPPRVISKRKRRKSVTTAIPEDGVAPDMLLPYVLPKEHHVSPVTTAQSYNSAAHGLAPAVYESSAAAARMAPPPVREAYDHDAKSIDVSGLPRHNSIDNDDEPKPFPCPECDKQFKRLEHLKRHIRSVHSNIRPFHCKYCDKKFSRSDNLAQHSKTHFKVNANGTTTIIYGNPNPQNRGGRKKSISSDSAGIL